MSKEFGHQIGIEEQQDLRNTDSVIVNSGKDFKFYFLWVYLQSMARGTQAESLIEGHEVMCRCTSCDQVSFYQEPKFDTAVKSSNHKAGYLNEWFDKVMTSGADSVFKVFNQETGEWDTFHKLGREVKRPEDLPRFYQELKTRYVEPKSGEMFLIWDLSATYMNGREHNFTEQLLVRTKTLDLELFNQYFDHALNSGLIYKASTGIALVEAIFENDPNTKIGFFTPKHIEELGSDVWKQLATAEEYVKNLVFDSVLSTAPLGIGMNDKFGYVFENAHQIAKDMQLIKSDETVQ